jgi:hypothetical protein
MNLSVNTDASDWNLVTGYGPDSIWEDACAVCT